MSRDVRHVSVSRATFNRLCDYAIENGQSLTKALETILSDGQPADDRAEVGGRRWNDCPIAIRPATGDQIEQLARAWGCTMRTALEHILASGPWRAEQSPRVVYANRRVTITDRHHSITLRNRTHCARGHTYDEANTTWIALPNGRSYRRCRACQRVQSDAHKVAPGCGRRKPREQTAERIRHLYAEGLNAAAIAERLGLSLDYVRTFRAKEI